MSALPIKLAVLISGSGTTLQNLIDEIAAGRLLAEIRLVVASRPGIAGIKRATLAGIETHIVSRRAYSEMHAFSAAVFQAIDSADVDLICLAGWLSLLDIPPRWLGKIINIHPSLLPAFGGAGMYGKRVHEAVLASGVHVSGCTVHQVDNVYDGGPIILQRRCPVLPGDDAATLAARVFEEEKIAYPQAIREMARAHAAKS